MHVGGVLRDQSGRGGHPHRHRHAPVEGFGAGRAGGQAQPAQRAVGDDDGETGRLGTAAFTASAQRARGRRHRANNKAR
jgi:hypothetical protein